MMMMVIGKRTMMMMMMMMMMIEDGVGYVVEGDLVYNALSWGGEDGGSDEGVKSSLLFGQ